MRRGAHTLSPPALLGAVLAGGESRRFGCDKASALVAGEPMVCRAADTLARVFTRVVVVSSRLAATPKWPYVPDLREGMGPLAGIEAALEHAQGHGLEGAFVLACDLPLVDEDAVRSVAEGLGGSLASAADRSGAPPVEPLCAAYRVACLSMVRHALGRGERAVHLAFARLGGISVRVPREVLLNVNSPSDAARAEVALRHLGR